LLLRIIIDPVNHPAAIKHPVASGRIMIPGLLFLRNDLLSLFCFGFMEKFGLGGVRFGLPQNCIVAFYAPVPFGFTPQKRCTHDLNWFTSDGFSGTETRSVDCRIVWEGTEKPVLGNDEGGGVVYTAVCIRRNNLLVRNEKLRSSDRCRAAKEFFIKIMLLEMWCVIMFRAAWAFEQPPFN
jgi:hypothetical protein